MTWEQIQADSAYGPVATATRLHSGRGIQKVEEEPFPCGVLKGESATGLPTVAQRTARLKSTGRLAESGPTFRRS